MKDVLDRIADIGVLPVIKIERQEDAIPLAHALRSGGINAIEVTVRNDTAYASIQAIAEAFPDMIVGAGTIRSAEMADLAIASGAKYLVSPGFNQSVVAHAQAKGIPIVPGCTTATEIDAAIEMGLRVIKFFPASTNGGTAALKLLSGPFPQVKFVPTGGIDFSNMEDYLRLPCVAAVGGSFMAKADLIKAKDWATITTSCRKAVKLSLGFSLAHVGLNHDSADEAVDNANALNAIFRLGVEENPNSLFCGTAVEFMKIPYYGTKGHIGFHTNSARRALAWFQQNNIPIREESMHTKNGEPHFFYLAEEIGGFAIHVVNR